VCSCVFAGTCSCFGFRPSPIFHKMGYSSPVLFDPCLLWPNGRPSQKLLSSCLHLWTFLPWTFLPWTLRYTMETVETGIGHRHRLSKLIRPLSAPLADARHGHDRLALAATFVGRYQELPWRSEEQSLRPVSSLCHLCQLCDFILRYVLL